jgi:dynein light intermediate chain 1
MPTAQSPLHTLVHSSLGIHSLLRKQPLKLNVIDRDKVVLPPNWDSWGKLRLLQESFDVEGFNQGWSLDIQEGPATPATGEGQGEGSTSQQPSKPAAGAVAVYEDTIQDPGAALLSTLNEARSTQTLDVTCLDPQEFLAGQLAILNNLRSTAPPPKPDIFASLGLSTTSTVDKTATDTNTGESRVSEHIGPVQFNMGGIQVDAEDMLQKLKERQNDKTPSPDTSTTGNEALSAFFARLINRDGESSTESHTT